MTTPLTVTDAEAALTAARATGDELQIFQALRAVDEAKGATWRHQQGRLDGLVREQLIVAGKLATHADDLGIAAIDVAPLVRGTATRLRYAIEVTFAQPLADQEEIDALERVLFALTIVDDEGMRVDWPDVGERTLMISW